MVAVSSSGWFGSLRRRRRFGTIQQKEQVARRSAELCRVNLQAQRRQALSNYRDEESDPGDRSDATHLQGRLSLDGDLIQGQIDPTQEVFLLPPVGDEVEAAEQHDAGRTSTATDSSAMNASTVSGDCTDESAQHPEVKISWHPDECNEKVQVGYSCSAGWEPTRKARLSVSPDLRKQNQDCCCMHVPFRNNRTEMLFGVFDGHGYDGRKVSQFVRDTLPEALANAYEVLRKSVPPPATVSAAQYHQELQSARYLALVKAFNEPEKQMRNEERIDIDSVQSGTTANIVWMHNRDLYCAWTGDSRSVIGKRVRNQSVPHLLHGSTPEFKAVDLSFDHTPARHDEKRRVQTAGGRVARWRRDLGPLRVWLPSEWIPGLAMTRSIGDIILSDFGVIPVPEITHMHLTNEDSFVVVASDGIWQFMESQEVINFVGMLRNEGMDARVAAEALVREAVRRWRMNELVVDDATCVIVYLDENYEGDLRANVASYGSAATRGIFRSGLMNLGKPHLLAPDGKLSHFSLDNCPIQAALLG